MEELGRLDGAGEPTARPTNAPTPASGERGQAALLGGWWTVGVPVMLMVGFAAVAAYLAIMRHDTLHTDFFDTGSYTQLVFNLAHGRPFAWSHSPPYYLGDHFSPLLAVLAPLFWFAPDARTLQAAGMLALATAPVPG